MFINVLWRPPPHVDPFQRSLVALLHHSALHSTANEWYVGSVQSPEWHRVHKQH